MLYSACVCISLRKSSSMHLSRETEPSRHSLREFPGDHSDKQNHGQLCKAEKNLPDTSESVLNNEDDCDDNDSSTHEKEGKQRSPVKILLSFFTPASITTKPGLPPDGGKLAWTQGESRQTTSSLLNPSRHLPALIVLRLSHSWAHDHF